MPHPDQKYIDAIVHPDPSMLEEIYKGYSDKVKEIVKEDSIKGKKKKDLPENKISERAADIFRKALFSIRNKAKRTSFTFSCSFHDFFLGECNIIIRRGLRSVEPEEND